MDATTASSVASSMPKKKSYAGYIVGGLVLAGAVVGVFVIKNNDGLTLWQKLTGGGAKDEAEQKEEEKSTDYTPIALKSGFPLNANEKNTNVRALQSALIKMGFPISGAPSDYLGANTIKALTSSGYSVPVSQTDYKDIISGKKKGANTLATGGFVSGKFVYASQYGKIPVKSSGGQTTQLMKDKGALVGEIYKSFGNTLYVYLDGNKSSSPYTVDKKYVSLT